MREASLRYKHRIYFYMPVSGPSLITGCPCALSQAGCLSLQTVEKRMLWLECCGVNSGEHSSQRWLIAGVAQPVEDIEVVVSVTWLPHTIRFHINRSHLTGSGLNTPFPNMKSFERLECCVFLLFWSCYQQRGARVYRMCHTSKPLCRCHSLHSGSGKKVISRRSPANLAGETTVFCSRRQQLLWFSLPSIL